MATHTRVGFQSVEVVDPVGGVFRNAPAAILSSLDDALDSAIAVNPRYEWRRVGEFVVVRPIGAWSDSRDPFNRPMRHFRAERTNEAQVLFGIEKLIHTGICEERPANGTPVAITVESGTLIDVIDRLAESADITFWQGGYNPHAYRQRLSRWDLGLTLVNEMGMRATTLSYSRSNQLPSGSAN